MYKIGDFSKIVDIPVRTLRYYAEYGVLVPSEIDKFTGYKYYSEANILLQIIRRNVDNSADIGWINGIGSCILTRKFSSFKGV